jgi:hypothetical protein
LTLFLREKGAPLVEQRLVGGVLRTLGRWREGAGLAENAMSKSRLAVVPGYSHYNLITSAEVPQLIGKFLADPLTNPPTGGTPASQAAPDLSKS